MERYLISFGKLNAEELEIVKGTLQYHLCLLADEFEIFKKEVYKSFPIIKYFIREKK